MAVSADAEAVVLVLAYRARAIVTGLFVACRNRWHTWILSTFKHVAVLWCVTAIMYSSIVEWATDLRG